MVRGHYVNGVAATPRRIGARISPLALALVGFLGLIALFALLVAATVHAVTANSDSATVALEGQSIAHGNLTLSGWSLSLDSFWTIDALFYALAGLAFGLNPDLVNLVPALLAVLVIALGAYLAGEGLAPKGALAAGSAVVVLLGLPSHALAFFFLQGPWHVGTALWCLVAFAALRDARLGWRPLLAAVFLAAGVLGDLQSVGLGVIPVALAGLVAMCRTRSWRAGAGYLVAAVGGVALALVVREVTTALGAFGYHESHHTASLAQMGHNLGHAASWSLSLLGVTGGPVGGPAVPLPYELAHLIGALAVLAAVVFGVVALLGGAWRGTSQPAGPWRLDDLLVLACLGDLGTFEVLALSKNPAYARYLTAAVIFATVLAARMIGRRVAKLEPGTATRALAVLALVIAGCFAGEVALDLDGAAPAQPVSALDDFLVAHHLHHGIGDYWAASIVTLETHGAVTVRPIVANASGVLVRDGRQSDVSWYAGQRFAFLVYQRAPYGRVAPRTIDYTFGAPARTYTIGKYYVALWDHPLVLPPGEFP